MGDYDLVVIGQQPEALNLSRQAIAAGLRVTLVSPTPQRPYPHSLGLLLKVCRDGGVNSWQEAHHQYLQAHRWLSMRDGEFELGSIGIDLIIGQGQFTDHQPLTLVADDRRLVSPYYVLALGCHWTVPPSCPPSSLTPDRLPLLEELPQKLALVGNTPEVMGIAPYLSQWGCEVHLITNHPQLLPQESDGVNQYLTHQLEAAGIQLYLGSWPEHWATANNLITLNLGDRELTVDQVMVSQPQYDPLNDLNLGNLGIHFSDRGLVVNQCLQTNHPQIYGCGDILGGYSGAAIANAEIDYLLKIFLAKNNNPKPLNYQHVGYYCPTYPGLGRVGFTPQQLAKRSLHYHTWTLPNQLNLSDQLTRQSPLWGRIYTDDNGHILGAELIGTQAKSLISTLAIAIQHRLILEDIKATLPRMTPI